MPRAAEPSPNQQTDESLGIGQHDSAQELAAMMESPVFKALIDRAVEERLAKGSGIPADAVAATKNPEFAGLLAAVERMFQLQAIQQPGYIKPISSEELERRAAGKVEMEALLREYQAQGLAPRYTLGDKFYAGDVLYQEGQEIRTYLPPAESFQPENEPAAKVYAAFLQSIGGSKTLPIGEQVEAAMLATKNQPPLVTGGLPAAPQGPVEVVTDAPVKNVRPKRISGTAVPETHGVSMPSSPASMPMPQGPVFVGT